MENNKREDQTWQANYYFRTKTLATRKLKEFETMGIKPNHTDRKVKKYSLRDYIEFLGQKEAAKKFDCSEASCKSWRYGYRQPTINQAKKIIRATDGRLDYESIYGSISEILDTEA
tara:strand:+ start:2599 stop:2946 length:348 start_codon:yes stop_codon:yes gene_type:complete